MARKIADLMLSKKAHNIVIMDLKKLTSVTDFFIVCTGDSDTHVKAIADAIRDGMEKIGEPVWHFEGYQALRWVVLDFVDVVAHVFYKDERSFYNLDRLWGDAKRIEVTEDKIEKETIPGKKSLIRKNTKKKKLAK